MPLIPAGLSHLNQKVESARKGFNAKLDQAGHKSGVFKAPPGSTPSSSSSSSSIYPSHPPPSIAPRPIPPSSSLRAQPPPPTRSIHLPPSDPSSPPPPLPPARPKLVPPPPPSRRIHDPASHQAHRDSYAPAHPPVYRPPPTTLNGYGPPTFPPVQASSRYGPPSPPRSRSQSRDPSPAHQPPPPLISSKPTNWQSSLSASQPNPVLPTAPPPGPPRLPSASSFTPRKHAQLPFPPFSQFTDKDKRAFFQLLDEFFAQKFPDRIPALNLSKGPQDHPSPPSVSLHTRPSIKNHAQDSTQQQPSKAESLAQYFKHYRTWTSDSDQWYHLADPVPTPVQGSQDVKRISAWSQTGNDRTQTNYILFSDLSQIWSQVSYDVTRPYPVRSAQARFRPPPDQFDRQSLLDSSQIYGHHLVMFAQDAERSGRHVARGECWDLANEALKAFPASRLGQPPPLTSISRTHGILLYYGRSTGLGSGLGSWKQHHELGIIRPGDVIEWRLVACETVNPKSSFTLGDPDHTAIIVDASGCGIENIMVGDNHPPYQLGYITVVEQSLKQIPIRRTYNLSTISKGEVWIYRPMAEADLLGPAANQCLFPPSGPTFEA